MTPVTVADWSTLTDFRTAATEVRETSGGVPIGAKLSAQRIEADVDSALEIDDDYVILDGSGGATGAGQTLFRDHISVPIIPTLARARRHVSELCLDDLTTFDREMHHLAGVPSGGLTP